MDATCDHDPLRRARALLDAAYESELTLEIISRHVGLSRAYFARAFRRAFGVTPHQYLTRRRIERARALLAGGELSVTEVCFAVGFQSLGSFSALFRRVTGHSPEGYRRRAAQRRAVPHCFLAMYGPGDLAGGHVSRSEGPVVAVAW